MQRTFLTAACALAQISAQPAFACPYITAQNPTSFATADLVLIGTIADYVKVRDVEGRKRHAATALNSSPGASDKFDVESYGFFESDHATFTVDVRKVLKGQAPSSIHVFWGSNNFGSPPDTFAGEYLFGLRAPNQSSNLVDQYDVVQGPCSDALLIRSDDDRVVLVDQAIFDRTNEK